MTETTVNATVNATVKKKTGSRGWLTRGRLIGAGVVTGALVLAGGGIAWANSAGAASGYRTAVATIGSVDETLTVNGALASATRRDRAFAASGAVDGVNVSVGDRVAAGDVLATIDPTELQDAVDAAESQLADAKQALATDLASQSSSSSSDAAADTPSDSPTQPSGASSDPALEAAIAKVVAAQQSLLALAQASADALAASEGTSASAATVCAPFLAATLDDGTVEPVEPAEPVEGDAPAAEPADGATPLTLEAVQQLLADCQTAITGVGDAQTVVASAQTAVQAAMADLDAAVTELRDAAAASGSNGSNGSDGSGSSTPSSTDTGSPTGGSGASAASAADIVADQAQIAVAEADLAIAQHELQAAQLTTPIAGTVASVGFAVGESVTAGSTTQVITIIGDDGYTVEATVTLAQIAKIEAGQTGTAVVTSSGASYDATVSSVGFVNVSDTSTPSYVVEIAIDPAGATLLNGAAVEVAIDLAAASDVLTVPLSALHVDGTSYSVQVLADGELTSVPVEVGAIGSESVEITSGLAEGDEVVIADLGADITSDDTTSGGFSGPGGVVEFSGTGPSFSTDGQRPTFGN
jgi:HlyD family secretion protein